MPQCLVIVKRARGVAHLQCEFTNGVLGTVEKTASSSITSISGKIFQNVEKLSRN
jgi:hypothetical protein